MTAASFLGFGGAVVGGVVLGQLLKWPLRGMLMAFGIVAAIVVLANPEMALAMLLEVPRYLAGEMLGALGYPREWGYYLFSEEWPNVLDSVIGGAIASANPSETIARFSELGLFVISRWDWAFYFGLLAGMRS